MGIYFFLKVCYSKNMKAIYKFVEYQPHMVVAVAIAYLGASIIAKTLCKEGEIVDLNNFKCLSSADVCHAPGEVTMPLVYAMTAGTTGTFAQTAFIAPQLVWDSETFTLQLS